MGEGFFPFGVRREDVPALLDVVRRRALETGRDPSSIEVTMESFQPGGEAALADVKAAEAVGATRVLLPAAMFGRHPQEELARYAEDVIRRI